jgi:hypothetical protein
MFVYEKSLPPTATTTFETRLVEREFVGEAFKEE